MKAYLFSLTFIFFALPLSGYDFNTYLDVKNFNKSDKYSQESESKETNYRIKKVVIDAGHGGKDSGCVGHSRLEKDLALKIALK
ncbi:MAG: N-acetylmuramoyl-L-alanine amidase, partial [Bacteroidota bacterium]